MVKYYCIVYILPHTHRSVSLPLFAFPDQKKVVRRSGKSLTLEVTFKVSEVACYLSLRTDRGVLVAVEGELCTNLFR